MKAIVLWTGGKDSFLALHEVRALGWEVRGLVTFAPPNPEFRAHPLPFIGLQAEALGIEHRVYTVDEPCHPNYRTQLAAAMREFAADAAVTGDIGEIAGHPNLIASTCSDLGVRCERPLWQRDRRKLLSALGALKAEVIVSCLRKDVLSVEWLGRRLDATSIGELQTMAEAGGFDACGEQGEYHTLVCDGPGFRSKVVLKSWSLGGRDGLAFFHDPHFELQAKLAA